MNKEIKQSEKNVLLSYVGKKYDKTKVIDEILLKDVVRISQKNNIEVAVVINRKGEVIDITTGDSVSAQVQVESSQFRSELRVIHTHPFATSKLSEKDLLLLTKAKLDLICAVALDDTGIKDVSVAYIEEGNIVTERYDYGDYINKYGILDKVEDIIKREKKSKKQTITTAKAQDKAILVLVDIKKSILNIDESMAELEGLCDTDNIEVVGKLIQNKVAPDPKFLIGSGKVEELKDLIARTGANLVVFENELSASKQSNLTQYLNVKVIDRSMLILDIFAKRARTNEGKLQVELAQLKYMLPRLKSYIDSSNRYGGGVGMRGPGETKLEMNRRVVENNIIKKSNELKQLKQHRDLNRKSRRQNSKPTISIVGYTNSGKSSLLNLLAKDNIYAKDELFATLDTTSRNVWLGSGTEVVVTDTVGFINNLPHEFIEAFASTLEECIYSDLLLLVVDISNPSYFNQMNVSIDVLKKLGSQVPMIIVYNKIDKVDYEEYKAKLNDGIVISVKTGFGIEKLKENIRNFFKK